VASLFYQQPGDVTMPGLVEDTTGNQLTFQIIGAAMAVHNQLGAGYKEEVYEKALFVELSQRGISAQRQHPVTVEHSGEVVGIFYLDILAGDQVVIEVKAFSHQLTNDELAQVINYLKASGVHVGLLFNFGRRRLEYRRVFPPKSSGQVQRIGRDRIEKPSTNSDHE
jgi:GxxExxY protein